MTHPDIWETVAEDGVEVREFEIDTVSDCWLLVSHRECIVGLYNLHPWNSTTLEMHIQILPKYRKHYARASAKPFVEWVVNKAPKKYQKLIAKIPAIYPNVRDFAEENGFVLEGTITQAYRKNGELVDIWLLGATRDTLKDMICQK